MPDDDDARPKHPILSALDPKRVWTCAIGGVLPDDLPAGADFPMRVAVREAFERLTGRPCEYLFSGWQTEGDLDESRRLVILEGRGQGLVHVQLWEGVDDEPRVSLHYDRVQRDLHHASVALLGIRTVEAVSPGLASGPCIVSIDVWYELAKLCHEANKPGAWFESADQALAFLGGGSSAARPIL